MRYQRKTATSTPPTTAQALKRAGLLCFVTLIAIFYLTRESRDNPQVSLSFETAKKVKKLQSSSSSSSSSLLLRSSDASIRNMEEEEQQEELDSVNGAGGADIYILQKRRDGCTGMFWRSDPLHQIKLQDSKQDWPRDGAFLKGRVRIINGTKWLAVTHVKNNVVVGAVAAGVDGADEWKEAPHGAHMPFEYDNQYYLELQKPK